MVRALLERGQEVRAFVRDPGKAHSFFGDAVELALGEFIDVPDEGAKQGMIQAGLLDFVAEQVVEVFATLRQGVGEQVTATVDSLTGSPPRDFASFAHDHSRLFVPAAVGAGR